VGALHRSLHDLPPARFEVTRVLVEELDSVLAVVAPFHRDHPRLAHLGPDTLARITRGDTLGIALPEGPFLRELGRLVDDIEAEVRDCADLIVDYGLQRYRLYQRPGINFDLANMQVTRYGACYELFRGRMKKWFDVDLPEGPPVHYPDGTEAIL